MQRVCIGKRRAVYRAPGFHGVIHGPEAVREEESMGRFVCHLGIENDNIGRQARIDEHLLQGSPLIRSRRLQT